MGQPDGLPRRGRDGAAAAGGIGGGDGGLRLYRTAADGGGRHPADPPAPDAGQCAGGRPLPGAGGGEAGGYHPRLQRRGLPPGRFPRRDVHQRRTGGAHRPRPAGAGGRGGKPHRRAVFRLQGGHDPVGTAGADLCRRGRGGGGHEPVGGGAFPSGGGAGGGFYHRPGPRPLLLQPEPLDRLFAGGKAAGRGRAPDARVSFRDGQCLERAAPETPPCRRPGRGDAGVGAGVGGPLRAGQRRAGGTADATVALPGGAVFQLPLCLLLPLRPRHPDAGEGRAEPPGPGEHPPLPLPPGAGNGRVYRPAAGGGP